MVKGSFFRRCYALVLFVFFSLLSGSAANWLCFTAMEDSSEVWWYQTEHKRSVDVQYSVDEGDTWHPFPSEEKVLLANVGDKVYLKGYNPEGFCKEYSDLVDCNIFKMTGKIAASGSVMSLIDGEGLSKEIPNDYCFYYMFYLCDALVRAPELPAEILKENCYRQMFYGTNIEETPKLPAKKMEKRCYEGMFSSCRQLKKITELPFSEMAEGCCWGMFAGCTSLTQIPELSADTLAKNCYRQMFRGCESLTQAPKILASVLADGCCREMFQVCESLMQAPDLPATKLANRCYEDMFSYCVSLIQTPELAEKNLAEHCYEKMFKGCVSLAQAPVLPANALKICCYNGMFEDCKSLTQAPELPAVWLEDGCYEEMFKGCESLTQAPELPAANLTKYCYSSMFEDCVNLNYIKVGVKTLDNDFGATTNWVSGVDGPGVFIFPCGSTYDKHGVSEVPKEFQIVSSPVLVFQNPDSTVLWRDTISCRAEAEYGGEPPTYGTNSVFVGWDKELTVLRDPGIYYYTAIYDFHGEGFALLDSVISACDSLFVGGRLFTESAEWKDTVFGSKEIDTLVVLYHLQISHSMLRDSFVSACGELSFNGNVYRESLLLSDTLISSTGCDSVVNYHLTVYHDVIKDTSIVVENQFTWKGVVYTDNATWSDTLQAVSGCDSIVNYNLVVHKFRKLHLTVDDDLILVLPGGQVLVGYELADGIGSNYEIRYGDKLLCGGNVENDSTVLLECPSNMEPGTYVGTMVMFDGQDGKAEAEFVFNVMLPDIKENSYYVKVWNDVVICRNGEGFFETFQWYKDRQVLEDATSQYYNDLTLLDGEYMVYVNDKYGKSYFIEPCYYQEENAGYLISVHPSVVNRGAEFTLTVSGVEPEQMENARIVVYRNDGSVLRIHNKVEEEMTMNLWTGDYVLVLTLNDGKNAYCKVVVK